MNDERTKMNLPTDVPWYEWACKKVESLGNTNPDAKLALSSAIAFADAGFEQNAMLRVPTENRNRYIIGLQNIHAREVHVARITRDAPVKVALAHAINQAFHAALHYPDATDAMTALCQEQPVPPGLVMAAAGYYPDKILQTVAYWEKKVSIEFSYDGWPFAWNTGICLTAFQQLLTNAGQSFEGIEKFLLNSLDRPLPKFSALRSGKATCIPTSPGLKVRLDCSFWLAQLLQHDRAKQTSEGFWSLDFDTKRIGTKGNESQIAHTGLKVGHLYYAVLIERLYQIKCTPICLRKPLMLKSIPSNLPVTIVEKLSTFESFAAAKAIESMQMSLAAKSSTPIKLKTRRGSTHQPVTPMALAASTTMPILAVTSIFNLTGDNPHTFLTSSNLLQFEAAAPQNKETSFGSIMLSGLGFDAQESVQWIDVLLLVLHKDVWFVIRPELIDDDENTNRVHLEVYAELPKQLLEVADVFAVSKAIATANWAVHTQSNGCVLCAAISI